MPVEAQEVLVRPLTELDIEAITRIDERVGGQYRPGFWEDRVAYYIRRDPEASRVAEVEGKVVGFMLADLRGGEFGLEETSGWIERFGVDPDYRGRGVGRRLFDALNDHFREAGAARLRTFVDSRQAETAQFLHALGFQPSALEALEMPVGNGAGRNP
jgi:ribosomal protein S18 acetylase RimI-like enzyme